MQFISALLFRLLVFVIRLIPFRLLYVLSDFLAFVLYRLVGYRRKVMEENLNNCFPEKDAKEIKSIVSLSYRNISDILLEGLKGFSMDYQKDQKRYKLLNPEFLEKYQKQHKNLIMVSAHYGNWEWGSIFLTGQMPWDNIIALYKPLKNKYLDNYMRKNRERFRWSLLPIDKTVQTFSGFMKKETIFTLVADQSPSNIARSYWIDFLGRKTAFLHGVEHYARQYDLPVVYMDVQRKCRGYYELTLSLLTDGPLKLKEGEVTALYAHQIEKIIRQKPQDWLWSHKRWKHKPPLVV